jgi:hypothetical protein
MPGAGVQGLGPAVCQRGDDGCPANSSIGYGRFPGRGTRAHRRCTLHLEAGVSEVRQQPLSGIMSEVDARQAPGGLADII